jgi:hypothetical protein
MLRYGDNFEWFVTLGTWEELQSRLDRLASAIVTDAPLPPAGGVLFELNDFTQPPDPHSQRDRVNGTRRENGDSGYVTPRTGQGLGVGALGEGHREVSRTPSPTAAQPRLDAMSGRQHDGGGDPRRRPAAGSALQSLDGEFRP